MPEPANQHESVAPVFAGFEVLRELGRGGKSFLREMEILKALRHRNVVRYIQSQSQGAQFWLVMEYCDGGSLDRLVRDFAGRIPIQFARPVMLQVLDGAAHAHERNIVHRDIKPQNIVVQSAAEFPVAKISDFGLAKSLDRAGLSGMTLTGMFAGTVDFMPREQITDYKDLRPCSDIWSLGAVFYFMLTGLTPRLGEQGEDPIAYVLKAPCVPIRERAPDLPADIAQVIDTALDENPARRYPSASEFREALLRARPSP